MATGVHSWSTTASSNATADSNVNWAEGMAPSAVNDSSRAAMASVAKFYADINGSIATGGSSTAYTVTSNQSFASLTAMGNAIIAFVPHTTAGAAPTLSVDGLTAKKIRFVTGVDLPSGVLIQGTPYVVTYYASVGEFIVHNIGDQPYNVPLGVGLDFWGGTAPNSAFVLTYGQAISRTTYSTLFSMFGTTYGTGDGSTTFNLPDKRGRLSVAKDDMGGSSANRVTIAGAGFDGDQLGGTGGAETRTLGTSNLPAYTPAGTISIGSFSTTTALQGSTEAPPSPATKTTVNSTGAIGNNSTALGALTATNSGTMTFTGTAQGGTSTPLSIHPPSIVCNYIMRII